MCTLSSPSCTFEIQTSPSKSVFIDIFASNQSRHAHVSVDSMIDACTEFSFLAVLDTRICCRNFLLLQFVALVMDGLILDSTQVDNNIKFCPVKKEMELLKALWLNLYKKQKERKGLKL